MARHPGVQVVRDDGSAVPHLRTDGKRYWIRKKVDGVEIPREYFLAKGWREAEKIRDDKLAPSQLEVIEATNYEITLDEFATELFADAEAYAKRGGRPGLATIRMHKDRYYQNISTAKDETGRRLGLRKLATISAKDIGRTYKAMRDKGWVDQNKQPREYSEATIQQCRACWNFLFKQAMSSDYDYVKSNPVSNVGRDKPRPKAGQRIESDEVFLGDELERFLAEINDNVVYWNAFYFARQTGLRIKEVLGMRHTSLLFLHNEIKVDWQLTRDRLAQDVSFDERFGQPGFGLAGQYGLAPLKGDSWWSLGHQRRVDMTPDLKAQLLDEDTGYLAWLAANRLQSEWLFPGTDGQPLCLSSISRAFRRAKEAAGIERKVITIHSLRHTYASYLIQHAADEQKMLSHVAHNLGHLNADVTRDVYWHFRRDDARKLAFQEAGEGAAFRIAQ